MVLVSLADHLNITLPSKKYAKLFVFSFSRLISIKKSNQINLNLLNMASDFHLNGIFLPVSFPSSHVGRKSFS